MSDNCSSSDRLEHNGGDETVTCQSSSALFRMHPLLCTRSPRILLLTSQFLASSITIYQYQSITTMQSFTSALLAVAALSSNDSTFQLSRSSSGSALHISTPEDSPAASPVKPVAKKDEWLPIDLKVTHHSLHISPLSLPPPQTFFQLSTLHAHVRQLQIPSNSSPPFLGLPLSSPL
jgi:hypothetical protein